MSALICPSCRQILEGEAAPDTTYREPKAGDMTACLYCAEILVFTDDRRLREATPAELLHAMMSPQIRATVQRIIQDMIDNNRPGAWAARGTFDTWVEDTQVALDLAAMDRPYLERLDRQSRPALIERARGEWALAQHRRRQRERGAGE